MISFSCELLGFLLLLYNFLEKIVSGIWSGVFTTLYISFFLSLIFYNKRSSINIHSTGREITCINMYNNNNNNNNSCSKKLRLMGGAFSCRVGTDLENLEKSGNLKETCESQRICLKSPGICNRIPKVREKSGDFVV